MNKKVLIAATLFTTMLMQAQEASSGDEVVKNKKGNEILPKAGDIALGFNAVPLINTAFNAIKVNQNAGTFQNIGGTNHSYVQNANNQIVGKYYLSAKAAIRGRIGINTLSGRITNRVQDSKALYDASFGTAEDIQTAQNLRVEDVYKFNKTNLLISAGYEMRRGYRRLQGYYGGEIAFGGGGNKEYFTYANDYSDLYATHFTNPAAGNFNTQLQHNPNQQGRQERVLHNNYRGNFRFGMRGFIGIEYFVFAKISVGAEFGWGWAMSTRTNKISTVEVYENGTSGLAKVFNDERSTDTNERQNGFSVDNNNGGNNGFSMNNLTGGGGNNNGNNGLTGGTGAITVLFHF
jgi:hypothetical protein